MAISNGSPSTAYEFKAAETVTSLPDPGTSPTAMSESWGVGMEGNALLFLID